MFNSHPYNHQCPEQPKPKQNKGKEPIRVQETINLVAEPWWEIPIRVVEEKRHDHALAYNKPTYVLVIIYTKGGMYMSQRFHQEKPMYLKYQAPCGKVEPHETGIKAACRELYEETGLSVPHRKIKWITNDPEFNCDIYAVQLKEDELLQRTEPENMSSWLWYP
jgi:ADP-ribose pyrophosphatase YjhB (NUDIX family)